MIRFGIIGYGFMGQIHEKNMRTLEGAKVTAVCDIDPTQLTDVPEGITAYHQAEELLSDPNVDVALISANNDQHYQLVMAAAAHKKHVLCEKPAAMTLDEYDQMVKACRDNGVTFTVHQQRRFDRDFRTTKEVLDSGTLGKVYKVRSSLYGFNGNMHDWHVYPEQGGGMLWDWGVHLLDQILFMIPGKLTTVYADMRNVINEQVDDYFQILMRFESGIMAEVELGTYLLGYGDKWFERHWYMAGTEGTMKTDGFEPTGHIVRTSELLQNVPGVRTMTMHNPTRSFGAPPEGRILLSDIPQANTAHRDFFVNYLSALRGETEFLVKPDEVRRVLLLMDAVRASAASGQLITFEP